MNRVIDSYPEFELTDFIQTSSSIECFACKTADNTADDYMEAMTYFYKEGWRMFKDQPYCRACTERMKK